MSKKLNQGDENGIKHGPWVLYYNHALMEITANEKIFAEGNYDKGNKTGLWKEYLTTGTLKREVTFVNGIKQGLYKVYYDSGVIAYEGQYDMDRKYNNWKSYDVKGVIDKQEIFII